MSVTQLAPWLVVASALVAATAAMAVTLAWPRLRAPLLRLAPGRRARALTRLCLAPLASAVALALACVLPSLYAGFWPALDHCSRHADEHLHLCIAHPPAVALGPVVPVVLTIVAVAAAIVGGRALREILRLGRARRLLGRLRGASAPLEGDLWRVDSDAVFSFTAGLLRPAIFLSRGLEARVGGGALAAVIAHERAHLRRRDVLRRQVASFASLLYGSHTRRSLLAALELACEEACDAEAAASVGEPEQVADAIVAVARLRSRPPDGLVASVAGFTADALSARVHALLGPRPREHAAPRWRLLVGLAVLVSAAPAIHHATETLLSWLAHP